MKSDVKGALVSYQFLARSANDDGRLQWSIVNKFHFWKHLADQAIFCNPRFVWTYMAEDYVGSISAVGASCLPGTGISNVNMKIAERIRLVRFLQLARCIMSE